MVTVNPDGSLTYTPDPGFSGQDTLIYQVCDDGTPLPAQCDTALVVINVGDINDPPVAVFDRDTTEEDTPVIVDVLANDSDTDGNADHYANSDGDALANPNRNVHADGNTYTHTYPHAHGPAVGHQRALGCHAIREPAATARRALRASRHARFSTQSPRCRTRLWRR